MESAVVVEDRFLTEWSSGWRGHQQFSEWIYEGNCASARILYVVKKQDALGLSFESRAALALAELHSIMVDLEMVEQTCERAADLLMARTATDDVLVTALSDAAIVRYARCFNNGTRRSLNPEILSDLPGNPLAAHQFFYDLRDKHIGHSVNVYEAWGTLVRLEDDEAGRKVFRGMRPIRVAHVYLRAQELLMLRDLASAARQKCEAEKLELAQVVWRELEGMKQEDLTALKPFSFEAPRPELVVAKRPKQQ